jgi:hypothetical protein
MYLVTAVLLVTLATSVTVGEDCGGALCAPDIEVDCKAESKPCANLYFYDENDKELYIHQGTNTSINGSKGVKGVSKVENVGEHGCYIIFKGKDYKSLNLCLQNMDKVTIGTQDSEYEKSVVRSVKYDPDCKHPSCPIRAGIPLWAIAVSVLVVLLVAVAIFVIYRRKSHEAVPSNDGA